MRDWYDTPRLEDVLEEQATVLPNGPLGLLHAPSVRVESGLPKEVVELAEEYLAGKLGTMEFAQRMEAIQRRIFARSQALSRP